MTLIDAVALTLTVTLFIYLLVALLRTDEV